MSDQAGSEKRIPMVSVAILTCKHLYPRRGVRLGQKVNCEVCGADRKIAAVVEPSRRNPSPEGSV